MVSKSVTFDTAAAITEGIRGCPPSESTLKTIRIVCGFFSFISTLGLIAVVQFSPSTGLILALGGFAALNEVLLLLSMCSPSKASSTSVATKLKPFFGIEGLFELLIENQVLVEAPDSKQTISIPPKADKDLLKEFERLEMIGVSQFAPTPRSSAEYLLSNTYKPKFRYNNVYAYEDNRFKMQDSQDAELCPFINASCFPGENTTHILTQGPLPNTQEDFWLMVWNSPDTHAIVMATELRDGNSVKCSKYWPDAETSLSFENSKMSVTTLYDDRENGKKYTRRIVEIARNGEKRKIWQFQIHEWKDGCTFAAEDLINFFEETEKDLIGPVIVHCSAGAGRTGTFTTCHYLYRLKKFAAFLKDRHYIFDLPKFVEFLRLPPYGRVNSIMEPTQYKMIQSFAEKLFNSSSSN